MTRELQTAVEAAFRCPDCRQFIAESIGKSGTETALELGECGLPDQRATHANHQGPFTNGGSVIPTSSGQPTIKVDEKDVQDIFYRPRKAVAQ